MRSVFLCTILFLFILPGIILADDVEVIARVDDSKKVYVGDDFVYQIIIDGENSPGVVDLQPLQKFNPRSAGNNDVSQTSIRIINGKREEKTFKRFVMNYNLTCNRKGNITIPPVDVKINGKTHTTNSIRIKVLKPAETDQLKLEVSVDKKKCFVGEPVEITFDLYVYSSIETFRFDIPFFSDKNFYVEDLSGKKKGKEYQLHDGTHVWVDQKSTVHNGRECIQISFEKVIIPRISGDMILQSSKVYANLIVGRKRRNDAFSFFDRVEREYKKCMVKSEPVKLKVSPLPEDPPENFYGLVGEYDIKTDAAPVRVSVGDPITFNIKIGKNNFLKPVKWPDLSNIPGMENFKIPDERSSPEIKKGYKIFTQTIRANNDKVNEIPPISLTYFDTKTGEYVTKRSKPIKLDVKPTKVLTTGDLVGKNENGFTSHVKALKKGISANYEGLDALNDQSFSPLALAANPSYLFIWAGPLGVFVLSFAARLLLFTTEEKKNIKKKKAALKKAKKQLSKAIKANDKEIYNFVDKALKKYVADKFGKSQKALTALDCFEEIKNNAGEDSAKEIKEILEICEAAQYASADGELDKSRIKQVKQLLTKIDKESMK